MKNDNETLIDGSIESLNNSLGKYFQEADPYDIVSTKYGVKDSEMETLPYLDNAQEIIKVFQGKVNTYIHCAIALVRDHMDLPVGEQKVHYTLKLNNGYMQREHFFSSATLTTEEMKQKIEELNQKLAQGVASSKVAILQTVNAIFLNDTMLSVTKRILQQSWNEQVDVPRVGPAKARSK